MANIEEAIRRLQYLYEVHGAEQVAAAQAAVTASTTTTEKASLSLEKTFNSLERRYVSTVKAQQDYQSVQEKVNAAVAQNPALMERGNVVLANAAKQYVTMAKGSELARYELINLGRQFQDVAVSLGSGQSPFTVLLQQGAQIADVFATTSGTVGGFVRQTATWAAGFATSAAGMATAAGAAVAAWVTAGAQFKSGQNDIERALAGMGAASGVTSKQINEIASASSSAFGISTKEAREAATAFAATGRIYQDNVALATKTVSDFAKATGTDAADATKKLAAAMVDPAAGALELNKQFNFLDATTLNYIRSLQAQGKEQEAQKALMDALIPKLQKMAEHTSLAGKAWDAAANAASNFWSYAGKAAPLGPSIPAPWEKLPDPKQDRLKLMSTDADAAARSIVGVTAQIETLQGQLSQLSKFSLGGGEMTAAMTAAVAVGQVRLQQLQEQNDALGRQAQATKEIAALYPGMSIEVATQLNNMNAQLGVAQAHTAAERQIAQDIALQVQLYGQGKTLAEQLAIIALQREINEANVSKSIAAQIKGLDNEIALSKARLNGTEAQVKAEQAYKRAIDANASEADAQALRSKTLEAEQQRAIEQSTRSQGNFTDAVQQSSNAISEASDGMQHFGWEVAKVTTQAYQMVDAFAASIRTPWNASISDLVNSRLDMMGASQFDAGGYTSTYDPLYSQVTPKTVVTPGSSADDAAFVGRMDVSSPAAIQSSLQQIFGVFTKPDSILTAANRLIDAAGPEQQASLIQQTIDQIRSKGQSGLATEEAIKTLTDKLEQLTGSTDSLNSTIQGALSPFYSQDPRTTKLGFRAGVAGNPDWMTGATNANPLVAVLGAGATAPGMASGGSFMVGGGYSANDNKMAVFPVASGEEVVVNRNAGSSSGQVIHIDNRIIVNGSVSGDTLSKMKVSRYQQSQRMSRGLAQA